MVSVILPFYNAEASLDAAIASIAQQTHEELGMLLVDNNSSDNSRAVARSWADRDQRIQVLREPRQGVAVAMNTGMRHANGQYIARMDADDVAHPQRIEKQVICLEANADIDVLGTQVTFRSTVADHKGYTHYVDWQNNILTPEQHLVKRFVDAPLAQPTVMFRKDLLDRCGWYSEEAVPEDFELWLRWMHQGVRFAKLPEPLLIWNDGSTRLSRTHPNFSPEAFDRVKYHWLAKWLQREHPGRPVLALGTSRLCQQRAALLRSEEIVVDAFSDVKERSLNGFAFVPADQLRPGVEHFIVSMISQRGAGDGIVTELTSRDLSEGQDFLLTA